MYIPQFPYKSCNLKKKVFPKGVVTVPPNQTQPAVGFSVQAAKGRRSRPAMASKGGQTIQKKSEDHEPSRIFGSFLGQFPHLHPFTSFSHIMFRRDLSWIFKNFHWIIRFRWISKSLDLFLGLANGCHNSAEEIDGGLFSLFSCPPGDLMFFYMPIDTRCLLWEFICPIIFAIVI